MVEKTVLKNGITVVYEKIDYVRSVSVGVFIKNGSCHEREDELGISHFIEHLFFKGTNKRTAKQIAVEMDSVGGILNAYTTKEYTCYHAKTLDTHFNLAADILSDMVLNSRLSDFDITLERNVVFEEISMYEDAPEELVHDMLLEAAWGKNEGIGAPTLGTHKTLESFDSQIVREYLKKMYTPENCVIAVAGNIMPDMIKILEEKFGDWEKGNGENEFKKPTYRKEIIIKKKDIEQVHFCLGFEAFKGDDDRNYPLLSLNNIFGSSMSSELFQKIREERGLVYSVYSYLTNFVPCGALVVSASMHPKNLGEVLSIIYDEIKLIKNKSITKERCEMSKEQLKGNYMLGLENVSSRMQSIGRSYLLYKKFRTPEDVLEKIERITLDDMYLAAETVLDFDKMCASVIGSGEISEKLFEV